MLGRFLRNFIYWTGNDIFSTNSDGWTSTPFLVSQWASGDWASETTNGSLRVEWISLESFDGTSVSIRRSFDW